MKLFSGSSLPAATSCGVVQADSRKCNYDIAAKHRVITSLFITCFVCSGLMTFSVTPASIAEGHTNNVTLTCEVPGSRFSLVTFMQISKVNPGGSLTPLVELIPGAQQPVYVDDELLLRSQVSGNINKGQGRVYMKVVISGPLKSDIGDYICSMSYLGSAYELGQASVNSSLHELDFSTLLEEKRELQKIVEQCTSSNSSLNVQNPQALQFLHLTVSPNTDVMENTSATLNLSCNAGYPGSRLSLVTLMLISKVMKNGSVVPVVEMVPGSPTPIFLDDDFRSRSHVTGDVKVSHSVFLNLEILQPKVSDSGLYRCSMSYVGSGHGMGGESVYQRLDIWTWTTLLAEIDRLKLEKQRQCLN